MLPLLVVLAVVFTPLGVSLLFTSYNIEQLTVRYDQCRELANSSGFSEVPGKMYTKHFRDWDAGQWTAPSWQYDEASSVCRIKFQVQKDIRSSMYMYYKLTNFYQNHREYVESYDLRQLKGEAVKAGDLSSDCKPLRQDAQGRAIYPCGLIANSLFNDTLSSPYTSSGSVYEMTDRGIAWGVDRSRFKKTAYNASDIVPPPNWAAKYPHGYTQDNLPDLADWEALQVWMRTSGLPNFMKLARKNETGLFPAGEYTIDIEDHFPVSLFGGTKSVVLSTSSTIGGRNLSLGIAYLVVASLSILFGAVFLVKYIVQPRKLGDHTYLAFGDDEQHNERSSRAGTAPRSSADEGRTAVREIL